MIKSLALLAVALATAATGPEMGDTERRFSVKADPGSAAEVNSVIARIAEPAEVRLAPPMTAEELLKTLCGDRAPKDFELFTRVESEGVATFVRYRPCLREVANLRARVTPGDTLEAMAVRFGMRPSSTDRLSVFTRDGSSKGGPKSALDPGDFVVAKKAPAWTSFVTKAGTVRNRLDLINLLAKEIRCGSEEPEACLTRRSILVVEEKPSHIHPEQLTRPPAEPALSPAADEPPGTAADLQDAFAGPVHAALSAAFLQPTPAPTPETAPIARDQWPYDSDLVARILTDAANNGAIASNIIIGVAENGLADKVGRPVSNTAFVRETADYPHTNGEDDDGNFYVDDWIGAGVQRGAEEVMASGDVSLCPTSSRVYSTWPTPTLQRMSHGTVVASVAAGGRLRTVAGLGQVLPRLIFFRMAKRVCTGSDDDGSGEVEAIEATDYLILREARVLNLSFFTDGPGGEVVRDRLKSLMQYDPPLLVLPAGNYISENLDQTKDCPACLGNPTAYSDVARYTLVVGAATRDRRIADYSGYGVHTVKIYAPGEPVGSVDLAGRSGDTLQPATSYSAPHVSFAGGLVQALGIRDIAKARTRLLLSTWPLHPDSRSRSDGSGGILDLVKAAAVRHHTLEVVRPDSNGRLERRTYVGRITGGLANACPGYAFNEASVHAIRFGEAAGDGAREAAITYRQVDPSTKEARTGFEECRSTGSLTFEAIRDGRLTINLSEVRLILFKGKYP